MKKKIVKGHSEDRSFLSNNLTSLLEWCLNYKKSVYFFISTPSTYYNVEIQYDECASEGQYLKDTTYSCYLNVFITNTKGRCIQKTLFVNSDDWTLEDAVFCFDAHYITTPIREFGE